MRAFSNLAVHGQERVISFARVFLPGKAIPLIFKFKSDVCKQREGERRDRGRNLEKPVSEYSLTRLRSVRG